MQFTVSKESILRPLQLVAGVVERKQTMPVLSNLLLVLEGNELQITGTDLEVELLARVKLEDGVDLIEGEITVPAKKFLDICKALPENSKITFKTDDQKAHLRSGRSRFSLATLSSQEFPSVERGSKQLEIVVPQAELKNAIDRTAFAMATQDVRYYLNGMLWELHDNELRLVATDGHRLAMVHQKAKVEGESTTMRAIIPRKGVMELNKLLAEDDKDIAISLGDNFVRATSAEFEFTSKLIDGNFPDYERVIPRGGDKIVLGDKIELRQSFMRTSILSAEKYRGVRIIINDDVLRIIANNPEQEEAEDEVHIEYGGEELEVGFNVSYLLDVSNVIQGERMKLILSDTHSSVLIEEESDSDSAYVVMPMRL